MTAEDCVGLNIVDVSRGGVLVVGGGSPVVSGGLDVVEGGCEVDVGGGWEVDVGGGWEVDVGGGCEVDVGGGCEVDVEGGREVEVGGGWEVEVGGREVVDGGFEVGRGLDIVVVMRGVDVLGDIEEVAGVVIDDTGGGTDEEEGVEEGTGDDGIGLGEEVTDGNSEERDDIKTEVDEGSDGRDALLDDVGGNSDPDTEGSRDDVPVGGSALALGGVAEDDKGGLAVVEDIFEVKGK